jgi:hypothetical protein
VTEQLIHLHIYPGEIIHSLPKRPAQACSSTLLAIAQILTSSKIDTTVYSQNILKYIFQYIYRNKDEQTMLYRGGEND